MPVEFSTCNPNIIIFSISCTIIVGLYLLRSITLSLINNASKRQIFEKKFHVFGAEDRTCNQI